MFLDFTLVYIFSFILIFILNVLVLKIINDKTPTKSDISETLSKNKNMKKKETVNESVDVQNKELLLSDISSMFEKEIFSDVDIQCGTEKFKAHKCILSGRSPVFEAMFQNPMKEKNENLVIINEARPEAVRAMLEHLYTGKINPLLTTSTTCELLALSDMYDLKGLKKSCVTMLLSEVCEENALKLLTNGDLYDTTLKLNVVQYICSKFETFEKHSEWKEFQKTNSLLAMELMTAKINYLKLNQ